jgi:hypothetical protein
VDTGSTYAGNGVTAGLGGPVDAVRSGVPGAGGAGGVGGAGGAHGFDGKGQGGPGPSGQSGAAGSTGSPGRAGAGGAAAFPDANTNANLQPQTVTFTSAPPTNATVNGPTYTVTATGGGSGNPVIFTVDAAATAVCALAGATVSFVGLGTCVIDANQAGNAAYADAPQAQQRIIVRLLRAAYLPFAPLSG